MPRAFSMPRTASHWPKWPETSSAPLPSARAVRNGSQPGPAGSDQAARPWNCGTVTVSSSVRPKLSAMARRMRARSTGGISGKIICRLFSTRARRLGTSATAARRTADPSASRAR